MITDLIFYVLAIFFVIGGLDFMMGNRMGLGECFERGIKSIGVLTLNMLGIFLLAPVFSDVLSRVLTPIATLFQMDPSILIGTFLACDMGGYQLSMELANSTLMGEFSGMVIASGLGATISFSIPVAFGMIPKKDIPIFLKGMVLGMIAIPFGCFVGGIVAGIEGLILFRHMIPLFVGVIILSTLILVRPLSLIKFFNLLSRVVVWMSLIGLMIAGAQAVSGVEFVKGMASLAEGAQIVVRIGIFIAGAYSMLEIIYRCFNRYLAKVGNLIGVNDVSVSGMIGNLVSNLLAFNRFHEMDEKGKLICSALCISGAFVFGGQLAFVNSMTPHISTAFIVSKFVGGFLSLILALLYWQFIKNRQMES